MTTDARFLLNLMRQQLTSLERQVFFLRQQLSQASPPLSTPRTFASLRGVWANIVVSEDDLTAARILIPEDL